MPRDDLIQKPNCRDDTAANWTANNSSPMDREIGVVKSTKPA